MSGEESGGEFQIEKERDAETCVCDIMKEGGREDE